MSQKSSARERRQARTRDEILNAAIELIMQQGFDKLQMREIARKVDYSIGGLYEYFGSKDEIIAAVCREGEARLSAHLGAVSLDQPVDQYLLELGLAYVQYARRNPQYFQLMFTQLRAGAEEYTRAPDIPSEGSYRLLVNAVQRGINDGLIRTRPGYGVDEIAYSLWGLVHGLATLQVTYLSEVQFDFAQSDRAAIATFIAGLAR
jgi:AcrR family transcriptional regulator